jgi:hypothetical protein
LRDRTKRSQHEITTRATSWRHDVADRTGSFGRFESDWPCGFFLMEPARDPPRIRPQRHPRL